MAVRGIAVLVLALATVVSVSVRVLSAQSSPGFGEPLPGLPGSLLSAFEEGRQQFSVEETAATGLGPLFNARSCVTCHSVPIPAGSAANTDAFTMRFGRQAPGQSFDPLLNLGGPSLQRRSVADDLEGCHLAGEAIPRDANAVGQRQPLPLFGLGLIQA